MNEFVRYMRFPLAGVEAMNAATTRSYPRHTHDYYGLGLMVSGRHSSWSGRGQVEAGPGEFICVNPGEVHDGRAVGGVHREWRILYFTTKALAGFLSGLEENAAKDFEFSAPVFSQPRLIDVFNQTYLAALLPSSPGARFEAETRLLDLFAGLSAQRRRESRRRVSHKTEILRVKTWIDESPELSWTLADLATAAGISRYQLIRGFAKEFGLTPYAYIVQRRLELAKSLLGSRESLASIAVSSGFSDQSHLTRKFLRHYGVAPHRYRLDMR